MRARPAIVLVFQPLKAELGFSSVSGGEPLELCDECGSPIEGGSCGNCSTGPREGASSVGAAPLDRWELSRVLGRNVGMRAHGSYALSIQQEEGMAPLRKEIESLVERFNASAEVKHTARRSAERLAVNIMDELGPTKAAIASVAQVFIGQGRNFVEVSGCISMVHPAMNRLRDLILEVYPTPPGGIQVLVGGRERPFRSYSSGIYRKLRIPLFGSDGDALIELKNARLTQMGFDAKRVEPFGPSEFRVKADERTFELFKILEEARLSGKNAPVGPDLGALFRKYSVSKLPLTHKLLKETGLLRQATGEYVRLFTLRVRNGRGRSPRKLAEEALVEACTRVIPTCLSNSISWKYHLKQSGMKSLVVTSELARWRG